ncbi:DUF3105 domain-containing protein [Pseudonocardia sp. KRD-184]|uniref:DUF3105 domain-containing protein n=1 Tax=Pseudonocardia oceani TaxID=2792013 RepID=A0ABS6UDM7_9PSEU|nr:DUF3105 domain-containing protein [Pseudonocardia oceani]MBW0093420.1 DUF3105 domain-containing protein [Pseudonocardia oceani]MBW0099084.1 DUF3105 domain-containing protein [Pseudonocardia oceani]MBW0113045.1 DUF3105 domain-containing protein [Pseudonocardia oceani]MBW0124535.1 DUF3105 domain-containing protein [Pseudonocardia oceani]MBW0130341.1 DUF3105 domain-containing protein [Pseudonocardia oceani]
MRRTTHALSLAAPLAAAALLLSGCGVLPGLPGASAGPVDLAAFTPTAEVRDPSTQIDGVVGQVFENPQHVGPDQRVAYTFTPPIGGNHDQAWAACSGVVYAKPLRSENAVHSLEHGAVWITYDPDEVDGAALDALTARVEGQPYMLLSPYPGQGSAISLQSWGHQLALGDADDPRIDQFVAALRQNRYTHPEPGASCDEIGQGYFDRDAPPPFAPVPGAAEVDGSTVVAQ